MIMYCPTLAMGGGHLSSRRYRSLHRRETEAVSQAWRNTAIMRLECVAGGPHPAVDMRCVC